MDRSSPKRRDLVRVVSDQLAEMADPAKAPAMAAYMKTDMPFYGVQATERRQLVHRLGKQFAFESRDEYEDAIRALWSLPHREEKYVAIGLAQQHREHVTPASLPLYEELIIAFWKGVEVQG